MRSFFCLSCSALLAACALPFAASVSMLTYAQDYPVKPIRLLTTESGSSSDVVARLLAQGLPPLLGQAVVVDNRGALSAERVAKAAPDGYTLLLNGPFIWLLCQFRIRYCIRIVR